MNDLRIVRGNDFYLNVPVRRAVYEASAQEQGDMHQSSVPVPLSECEELNVNILSDGYDSPIELEFTIDETREAGELTASDIVAKAEGGLECGWYGVEIVGKYNSLLFRSYKRKVFKIVEDNDRSNVDETHWQDEEPTFKASTMYIPFQIEESDEAEVISNENTHGLE